MSTPSREQRFQPKRESTQGETGEAKRRVKGEDAETPTFKI